MENYEKDIEKFEEGISEEDKHLCNYLLFEKFDIRMSKIKQIYKTLSTMHTEKKAFELILAVLYLMDIHKYHLVNFCPKVIAQRCNDIISKKRYFFIKLYKHCTSTEIKEFFIQVLGETLSNTRCTAYLERLSLLDIQFDDTFKKKVSKFAVSTNTQVLKENLDQLYTAIDYDGKRARLCKENEEDAQEQLTKMNINDYYMINDNRENLCLIFNDDKRKGSELDVEKLIKTFSDIKGFTIKDHKISSKLSFIDIMKHYASINSPRSDMIVCCILSHGKNGMFIMKDEDRISENDVIRLLSPDYAPTLANKPKIFIFQVCRGGNVNKHVIVSNPLRQYTNLQYDGPSESNETRVPQYCDYIICHSTVQACKSSRDIKTGSWYIQTLCNNIDKYKSKKSLQDICIQTNNSPPTLEKDDTQISEVILALTKPYIFLEKPC